MRWNSYFRSLSEEVLKLANSGKTKKVIAEELNNGIASVFRILSSFRLSKKYIS